MLEARQFSGSTTSISEIQLWMSSGKFNPIPIHTQDIRQGKFITGEETITANAGDWIVRTNDKWKFIRVSNEFYQLYIRPFCVKLGEVQNHD